MNAMDVEKQVSEIYEILSSKDFVLFDWNGTLLDDLDHTVETANHFLSAQNIEPFDRDSYRKHFNFPVKDCYEKLGYDFDILSYEEMSHQFVDRFMAGVHQSNLFDFARPLLQKLKNADKKVFLLSATEQNCLDQLIEQFDLNSLFTGVYGINNRLAASKVYRGHQLIEEHGVDPAQSVMVGDTLHDLEVAETLGMDAVLIDHGHHCTTRLVSTHTQVLNWHHLR